MPSVLVLADVDCILSEGCLCWFKIDAGWTHLKLLQSKLTHIMLNALFTNDSNAENFFSRFVFFFPGTWKSSINVLLCIVSLKRDFYVMFSCKYSWSKFFLEAPAYIFVCILGLSSWHLFLHCLLESIDVWFWKNYLLSGLEHWLV